MEVILLEKVARLGNVGEVVNVKSGYGRNFLMPQNKAVRATKANIADIEARRDALEKQNDTAKKEAEKLAKSLDKLSVKVVRQASEDGKLYGSVNARDVAAAVVDAGHNFVERRFISLNDTMKSLGLYQAVITLHPEVKVTFDVQVVRTLESSAYDEIASDDKKTAAQQEDNDDLGDSEENEDAA